MVLMKSCCFFKSLRNGCVVSGIYTLIYYTLMLTASTFQIHDVMKIQVKLIFTIVLVILSVTIIITSIILIIGIHVDNKSLIIPWILMVTITTLTDIGFNIYMIASLKMDPFMIALHAIDFMICALNTYCLLCVISHYQMLTSQSHRHQEFPSHMNSEDVKIQCITNDTSTTCQFSNSANKDAANSTYGDDD